MVFLRTSARGTFIQKSVIIILAFICIASLLANREKVSTSNGVWHSGAPTKPAQKQLSTSIHNTVGRPQLSSNSGDADTQDAQVPTKGVHDPNIDLEPSDAHLHLLIPATSSNQYLCQLLLSAAVLNYPTPTLINWAAKEDDNEFVQHLAKISKILEYLKSIPQGKEKDLVLIVDGFDVWFQLRSDVLIKRYFAINNAANKRISKTLGNVAAKMDIKQTVIFGPDKLCWPSGNDGGRAACWALPQSTLPKDAFGPINDTDIVTAISDPVHSRPRWLNSGTVMGTLEDVRGVFEATLEFVKKNHTSDSDQWYLANLFAAQEYSRTLLQKKPSFNKPAQPEIPVIEKGKKTEYHIGLDYESELFQTVGYYQKFISWLWYDAAKGEGQQLSQSFTNPHGFELPEDVQASPPPFSVESKSHWETTTAGDEELREAATKLPLDRNWKDLPLATNVVTKQIFAIIHFTFMKDLRDEWWRKMWYYQQGKELLLASGRQPKAPIIDKPVHGQVWWNADASHRADSEQVLKSTQGQKGGAWSDQGKWVPWDEVCLAHEGLIFPAKTKAR